MGEALQRGMVFVMSVWNDQGGNMTWLDSGSNGPCTAVESGPAVIVVEDPTTNVTFSNIRWGDIGSTYRFGGGNGNGWGHGGHGHGHGWGNNGWSNPGWPWGGWPKFSWW